MPVSGLEGQAPRGVGSKDFVFQTGFLPPTSEKAQEEPPAKLLDDLFRKTKAAPCIYWLPLTESQVSSVAEQWPELVIAARRRAPLTVQALPWA